MQAVKVLNGIVVLIGLYMVVSFGGGGILTAPTLSGVAFMIIGAKPFFKK